MTYEYDDMKPSQKTLPHLFINRGRVESNKLKLCSKCAYSSSKQGNISIIKNFFLFNLYPKEWLG